MIITISGVPGAGKTTLAKALAKKLSYRFVSIGDLRGEIAKRHGMTINELNRLGESEAWTDKEADDYLVELGNKDKLVIDTYLGWHFVPNSFKVYLKVAYDVGAGRIIKDPSRDDEKIGETVEEHLQYLRRKVESDTIRYQKWYGVRIDDESHYDLVIDTTHMETGEVLEKVLRALKA